jgi:dolichol-phosphate mannosyltransferase
MIDTIVIIPTYNESENISSIIHAIFKEQPSVHILVVDDNSPDKTFLIVKELIANYPKNLFVELRFKKQGLGVAYKFGFGWALKRNYEFIFQMDADFSHNPKELKQMIKLLKSESDVIIGSRYIKGINVVNWPLSRILLSIFASFYVRFITGMPIKDPTAGFVGYRKKVLNYLDLDKIKYVGYAFQIEMKYKSWKNNFILKEHPIIFLNREKGNSKMDSKIIFEALIAVPFLKFKTFFK